MKRSDAREQAFLFIFESIFKEETIENIIENAQIFRGISIDDFTKKIFYGYYNNKHKIDKIIEENAIGWKKSRISKVSISALKLAIYEMLFENSIPVSVSINEAVELTKKYSTQKDAAFVNGILGTISKSLLN